MVIFFIPIPYVIMPISLIITTIEYPTEDYKIPTRISDNYTEIIKCSYRDHKAVVMLLPGHQMAIIV